MDPVSHVALGAAAAQARTRPAQLAAASLAGALGALAPDLDLLIRSSTDPLLFLEMHRQFTHSLVFGPAGALVVAALLHAALRGRIAFLGLWGFCTLGYVSHVLLDACTTFGVMLFWPVSPARPAASIISAFDPLLTLPVVTLAVLAVHGRRSRLGVAALGWAGVYLTLAFVQAERAGAGAARVAAARGHAPERLIVAPSFANTLVWKTLYEHDGRYYTDAIRAGLGLELYAGDSVRALDPARDLGWLAPGSRQARDVERFARVANGYVVLDPDAPNRVVELRYSLVPNAIAPYWALELDPDAPPDAHARFVTTDERTPAQGLDLLEQVLGRADGTRIE